MMMIRGSWSDGGEAQGSALREAQSGGGLCQVVIAPGRPFAEAAYRGEQVFKLCREVEKMISQNAAKIVEQMPRFCQQKWSKPPKKQPPKIFRERTQNSVKKTRGNFRVLPKTLKKMRSKKVKRIRKKMRSKKSTCKKKCASAAQNLSIKM